MPDTSSVAEPADPPTAENPKARPPSPVLAVLAALVALLGGGLAWTFASPVGASPDEPAHLVYAWGVATGQGFGDRNSECGSEMECVNVAYEVPSRLLVNPSCFAFKVDIPGNCTVPSESTQGSTYMVRYPPAFYLVVGLAVRTALALGLDPAAGFEAGRLAALGLALSLLLPALVLVGRRHRLAAAASVTVLTPMAMFLAGSINPSGTEAAAAVASGASAVMLLGPADRAIAERHSRSAIGLFWYATFWLAWARPIGWIWSAILTAAVVGHALIDTRSMSDAKRRLRSMYVPLLGPVINTIAAFGWFVYAIGARSVSGGEGKTMAPTTEGRAIAFVLRWGELIFESISALGWLAVYLPKLVYLGSFGAVLGVMVLSLSSMARPRQRLVIGTFLAVVTVVIALMYLQSFLWQGRYALPPLALAIVLATARRPQTGDRASLTLAQLGWTCTSAGVIWLYARYARGLLQGPRYVVPNFGNPERWETPIGNPAWFLLVAASWLAGLVALQLIKPSRVDDTDGYSAGP